MLRTSKEIITSSSFKFCATVCIY